MPIFAVAKSTGAHFWALFVCRLVKREADKFLSVKHLEQDNFFKHLQSINLITQ